MGGTAGAEKEEKKDYRIMLAFAFHRWILYLVCKLLKDTCLEGKITCKGRLRLEQPEKESRFLWKSKESGCYARFVTARPAYG